MATLRLNMIGSDRKSTHIVRYLFVTRHFICNFYEIERTNVTFKQVYYNDSVFPPDV